MKRILSVILSFMLILAITGCTPETEQNNDNASSDTKVEYPVTVTDQAGREVTIEQKPERLVSGYYISTSMLIALGQKDRLAGIEAKAETRPIYKLSAPELLNLPNVGSAKEFDLEGCAALEPDLAILPMKLKDAATSLEELGIPVLLINPENSKLLEESIELISTATDSRDKARQLLDFTSKNEKLLKEILDGAKAPDVYLAGNSNMLSTAGSKMYQNDMIKMAGGNNVACEITDEEWAIIDYEQLLTWNPQYIIIAAEADYTLDDVMSDPNLAGCKAVKNGNVYQMPTDAEAWDSPVPSGILGSVWLSSVLHPDLMSEKECNEIIDEFYETFYDFKYSEI